MGKILNKMLKKRNARRNAMEATRANVKRTNSKIPVDLAFKMPGSMNKHKG